MSARPPASVLRAADLVQPALQAAVATLADEQMRLIGSYQLGWCDAAGNAGGGHGGKGIRGALAVLAAEAAGCSGEAALPAAVAVELVHNFSLLHDDIMDRDTERRHRPTGWVAFGDGAALLAGTALLTLAVQVLTDGAPHALPCLLDATQLLISGQSDDLRLERAETATVADVLHMEAGKTAALLRCAAELGPTAAGAAPQSTAALARYGHELGMAFQLVDDILGITGDPAATGKSASSDLRAGKRSAPVVAALSADNPAARQLSDLLRDGPPKSEDDVALAAMLVDEAGGIDWARTEARARVAAGCAELRSANLVRSVEADLVALGTYFLERDR
jgi:geranylgeranyl diphosphate synthase type I